MDLPFICPALNCRAEFDLIHCDICPHGGVIHRRHDYIKSILAHHAEKAFGCSSVDIEPDIGPIEDEAMDIINGNLPPTQEPILWSKVSTVFTAQPISMLV